MMRQYELVERVLSYDPKADEALLNRAYVYAMKAHGNQKRASGDPYFSHPLEVAAILTDLKLDDATIVTALLHDVIEDTPVTRAEIDQLFGPEIGRLVDGLTKIRRLDLVTKKAEQAENFRKLLVAISSDIRVLLVKLADRVHNMRTMEYMKPESRKRISEETLDIYAPLAARMGMEQVREELEDHAFRWLHPDAYAAVTAKLAELRKTNQNLVEEIRAALAAKLAEVGIDAEVSGREKKPYAIWRKMANKQISLEQLSDIYAFRVITKSIDDCYRVLGVAHTTWRTVPGRFKDYISTPKQNNYQSIHTTIVGPRHQRVELQIRSRMMHEIAEYGVAAHAIYKDAARLNGQAQSQVQSSDEFQRDSGPYVWLRRLVETLLEGSNSEEFLEHTKLELFQDQVFCFSPKGRLIALPRGATPLDFAYAVHTDVGNAAVGAFVNGRRVPIDSTLRNGDEVEIETAKNHTPPVAWENLVVTGRARSAIRRAARDAVRRQYSELGRRLIAAQFDRLGEELTDDVLKKALPRLGYKSADDVLAAVGRDELDIENVLKAAIPEALEQAANKQEGYRRTRRFGRASGQEGWFNIDRVMSLKFREGGDENGESVAGASSGLAIRGVRDDLPVTFEPGGAVPGDRIVGVMIPGEGIRIFQIHSPHLRDYEHEGWIDVTWDVDPDTPQRFPARISVTALNEPGTLAQISKVIGEAGGNIDNVRMVRRASDFTEMRIELEVLDLVHLNHIIAGLREKAVVNKVERVFD
ncbi:RelA/SpoT family protein [Hyphomicrobium sulfonivorans]|uniref:RelA/SpoT family protein n=1 Tax=Hyphomicrobium sulfonivorans TaxID=121290 RepID=UPI00156E44B5|nr:bifunctional (p)ppGpp synthetase/guanosine-3',5'-bis(diphosphate) 3'-pyrophosphohydrolase [Hyphomicrobium sulfonivorans]MBI1650305.1 bifunctional (p)ppGpp synthetase/guanosine-3',5'-bis(diphosphate) 3'-pyrophosphohydrolase [Hyphomicrobium sulfonivorans]NSL72332.1 bifunctional (p)ppGpp synthetase/guanosine-3',5'-bis(diphosphate) 3'-pyrophosphohydrolase [Hyphomicrobium sulfonivorans]